MTCQRCNSSRILSVDAKCSDACVETFNGRQFEGYVKTFGSSDYIEFDACLDCGQLQGTFPVQHESESEIEKDD